MFLGGMFRGAARQGTGAQQRAAEDYVSAYVPSSMHCFFNWSQKLIGGVWILIGDMTKQQLCV